MPPAHPRTLTLPALATFACALALLAACAGEEQRQPPSISQAVAARDLVDGFPGLTTTVNVRFSRALSPPDDEIPLTSGFEVRVPDPFGEGEPRRVFPVAARQPESDSRTVELVFDSLVPDGSELVVAARLLGDEADASTTISGNVTGVQAVLASSAMAPGDPAILDAGEFSATTADDRDAAAMRTLLEEHLVGRESSAEATAAALARYDAMPSAVVTSPKLRAALAALTGTFAEPAIDDLLTGNNCTGMPAALIAFQDPPDAPELFARVTHTEAGARIVSVSPRVEGEPLDLLIPLMAHEAIHCDRDGSVNEEIVATSFDTLLYIQLLTVNPELARHGSPLSKELNVDAIAMINSGRNLPESIGILPSPGVRFAVPNTTSEAGSFAELVANTYAGQPTESPSEPLATVYGAVLATVAGLEPANAFDLNYLDAIIGTALDPRVMFVAIEALGLQPES